MNLPSVSLARQMWFTGRLLNEISYPPEAFVKMDDFSRMVPSHIWTSIDEHEGTIDSPGSDFT